MRVGLAVRRYWKQNSYNVEEIIAGKRVLYIVA